MWCDNLPIQSKAGATFLSISFEARWNKISTLSITNVISFTQNWAGLDVQMTSFGNPDLGNGGCGKTMNSEIDPWCLELWQLIHQVKPL